MKQYKVVILVSAFSMLVIAAFIGSAMARHKYKNNEINEEVNKYIEETGVADIVESTVEKLSIEQIDDSTAVESTSGGDVSTDNSADLISKLTGEYFTGNTITLRMYDNVKYLFVNGSEEFFGSDNVIDYLKAIEEAESMVEQTSHVPEFAGYILIDPDAEGFSTVLGDTVYSIEVDSDYKFLRARIRNSVTTVSFPYGDLLNILSEYTGN